MDRGVMVSGYWTPGCGAPHNGIECSAGLRSGDQGWGAMGGFIG